MSIRNAQFYSIWPVLGKYLPFQWGNQRQNTAESKAQVRAAVLDVQDNADILNARKAVAGRETGELDFQRRWRSFYDKDEDKFKVQRNTGTQDLPTWTDVAEFSDGTGDLVYTGDSATFSGTVFATGGFSSSGGFYGISHPQELQTVSEFPGKGTFVNTVTHLYFNDEGFYLSKVKGGTNQGQPVVNLIAGVGRAKNFPQTSNVEWQVDHNFGVTPVVTHAYDPGYVEITPHKVDVSNPNTTYFYFLAAQAGHAHISTGGLGVAEIRPLLTITDDANTYNNTDTLKFQAQDFYIDSDLNGKPVVNLVKRLEVTDGANLYVNPAVLNFQSLNFYLDSKNGEPVVNIVGRQTPQTLTADSTGLFLENLPKVTTSADTHQIQLNGTITSTHKRTAIDGSSNELSLVESYSPSFGVGQLNIDLDGSLASRRITWNTSGNDVDFIIEGDTDTQLFHLNAGLDRIGIGTSAPTEKLDIAGDLRVRGAIRSTGRASKVVADGFYQTVGGELLPLTVRQTDGLQSFSSLAQISFEAANFYLTQNSAGDIDEVIVNFRGTAGTGGGGGVTSHSALTDLDVPGDHTWATLIDGTRAFTGNQSMGSNKLTNVGAPTVGTDAARLQDIGPGFYGVIWNDGSSVRRTDRLHFNASQFYISGYQPVLNLVTEPGRSNVFAASGVEWQINHGYDTTNVLVQVVDNDDRVVLPHVADLSDPNTAYFYFTTSLTGKVRVAAGGAGIADTTASNLAGAEGIFSSKVGADLRFKSLTAGSNVNLLSDANTITISATAGSSARHNIVTARGFYGGFGEFGLSRTNLNSLNGNTKDLFWDWDIGNVFHLPIRRPMTIHTPSNLPGSCQVVNLVTVNDGFYGVTWSSKFIFPGGNQINVTQGAGKVDLWSMIYNSAIDRIIVTKAADCFY